MIIIASVFIGFTSFVWIKLGALDSISKAYYKLGKIGYTFSIFCIGISLPLMMIDPWLIPAGAFGFVLASAPMYKKEWVEWKHYAGAGGLILGGFVWVTVMGLWWPVVAFLVTCAILKYILKIINYTWWVEYAAFVWILIGIYLVIN